MRWDLQKEVRKSFAIVRANNRAILQHVGVYGGAAVYDWKQLAESGAWSRLSQHGFAPIKRIAFSEHRNAELRFEVFNLTNTPPLGAPNVVLASPEFGSITSAGDPRVIQLGAKFNF